MNAYIHKYSIDVVRAVVALKGGDVRPEIVGCKGKIQSCGLTQDLAFVQGIHSEAYLRGTIKTLRFLSRLSAR